ncbi:MAG: electron transfer flavoprotein subunit alpha/FixB family protein [Clostridiales bacterium]|nr:electron transfer flavoprotein subunit alpha/FixB family protein [Clostridiales bacterium]
MKKALVYIENGYEAAAIDLLEVVRQVGQNCAFETCALCLGGNGTAPEGYFDRVIRVVQPSPEWHDVLSITNAIEELHERDDFDCIVILATPMGRLLAPRLAMRLRVGLVADVTDIRLQDGEALMVRPAFDGKILAGIVSTGSKPLMMSVRPGVFSYKGARDKATDKADFIPMRASPRQVELLEATKKKTFSDIRDCEVLISGGGGIIKGFDQIQPLADELRGMVSASRRAVDNQIAPRSIQVGQSGKMVSPKLYLALGIHGSMQHFEGLRDVKHIVCANTDRYAPICSQADIVVEGDALEFVNRLLARIRRGKESKG